MLENLLNLVKQFSGDAIVNNPEIPNERNNEAIGDATHSIFTGLQNAIAGGGLQNVMSLLSGKGGTLMSNPFVQMIAGGFIKKLMSKFNLSPAAASNIANGVVPNVLNNLVNQTNDPNNSNFDLQGILSTLTGGGQSGGGGFDIGGLINKFTGGGQTDDGGGNGGGGLSDIISAFTGGAQNQIANQNSNGGVTGLLQKLIGGLGG
jgi:hypothetical protein